VPIEGKGPHVVDAGTFARVASAAPTEEEAVASPREERKGGGLDTKGGTKFETEIPQRRPEPTMRGNLKKNIVRDKTGRGRIQKEH